MRILSLLFWGLILLVLTAGILGGAALLIWSMLNPGIGADLFSLMVLPGLFALFLPKARLRLKKAWNAPA